MTAKDENGYWLEGEQKAAMVAVAELPQLRDLAVSDSVCGVHIKELARAEELTRLEFVYGRDGEGRAWVLLQLGLVEEISRPHLHY